MKMIYKIARTELRDLFYSPIAWLILVIFAFQCGVVFSGLISEMVRNRILGYRLGNVTLSLFGGWSGLFATVQSCIYLYIPLLTMGLMSRELGSGSIKLLYSSPVTNFQIIAGKYLAMILYGLVLLTVLVVYVAYAAFVVPEVDMPVILTGLLGVYLLICAYAAVGLFMSSITSYQIVAAVGTLAVLAALTYVKGLWQSIAVIRDITYWLAMTGRADTFVNGMITSEDFLYFIIVICLFLSMAVLRLQARRMKTAPLAIVGKYAAVWAIAIVLGYFSSRPHLMACYDATRTKSNTLTPNSRDIVKEMKGGLTITAYVNLLDKYFWIGVPGRINEDLKMFKQYLRFKPEIKMKYVYYYDTVRNESLEREFKGLDAKGRAMKVAELNDIDPGKVLAPSEIRKLIDLSSEGNRFVRLVERESGEKTFLRVFDDNMIFPYEMEISSAFKRLVAKVPKVGFVSGHGDRSIDTYRERDYSMFAAHKPFRYSLINQGFEVVSIRLTDKVGEDVDIMVIADMRTSFDEEEMRNLEDFVERGGNLLIVGEAGRQEVMNPLAEKFGLRFCPGRLVSPQENFPADLITAAATPEATELSYLLGLIHAYNSVVTMPGACGIDCSGVKDYKTFPLFKTSPDTWNEMKTADFVNDTVRLNPEAGERLDSYVVGLALSRNNGEKMQKIAVLGDADCIANGELGRNRSGITALNYSLIQGIFSWLADGKVPIDVRRPSAPDNKLSVSESGAYRMKIVSMAVIPGIVLLLYLWIWIKRRSR